VEWFFWFYIYFIWCKNYLLLTRNGFEFKIYLFVTVILVEMSIFFVILV